MKISRRGVLAASLTTVIFTYALSTRSVLALSIAVLLIMLLYLDYVTARKALSVARKLTVERVIRRSVVNEQERFTMQLRVTNRQGEAIPWIEILDKEPDFTKAMSVNRFALALPSRAEVDMYYDVKPLAPGHLSYEEALLRVSGFQGFFYDELTLEVPGSVTVLPLTTDMKVEFRSLEKLAGTHIAGKSKTGLYELSNMREYVPGDDTRKILWKHYAKTGKLYVREDYGDSVLKALVILDVAPFDWLIGSRRNSLAHIKARTFASIVNYLARAGCNIDVVTCVEGFTVRTVYGAGDPVEVISKTHFFIPVGSGCTSFEVYAKWFEYLFVSPERYDLVLMLTSPISLLYNRPEVLKRIFISTGGKLTIVIPAYDYDEVLKSGKEQVVYATYKHVSEAGIGGVIFLEEPLKVVEGE
ncbi:MAG: DUF58 domain-containing protein [Desulfurococcaceae archaeon]